MIDMKPEVLAALRGDSTLAALIGKDANGNVKVYPEVAPDGTAEPYITFFEVTNFEATNADDEEVESEIHMQVDIWTKGNTGPAALAAAEAMKGLGFIRTAAVDQYESDTKTYHKILRFQTTTEVQ
ncbi:DUF3168 domain-containing protein [Cohnella lubricantis]|uniref:DUF3168 domain-containing protein n=1 Tax=Cohnella lubricantis TaxID=2163172 RepID=A0A841T7N0_9BACL|nr:DUF3168 domain-containing protein [Cohnella lubricantis]MBB6677523.1 DUF3168 domain-containing protein [Cohnella lubricantis]MBP2116591.1 hypothetical protein [Cohnella lubricantis]